VTLPSNFFQPSSLQTNAEIDLNNTAIKTVCNYVCSTEVKLLAGEYLRGETPINTFSFGDMRGFIDAFGLSVVFANTVNSKDPTVRALFSSYVGRTTYVAPVAESTGVTAVARQDTLQTFIVRSISPAYVSLNRDVLAQLQSLQRLIYNDANETSLNNAVKLFPTIGDIAAACSLSNGNENTTATLTAFTGPSTWGVGRNYPNLSVPFATAVDAVSSFTLVLKGVNAENNFTAGTSWITVGQMTGVTGKTAAQLLELYNGFVGTSAVSINVAHPVGMSTYMNEKTLVEYYSPSYYGARQELRRGYGQTPDGTFQPGFAFDAVLAAYTSTANRDTNTTGMPAGSSQQTGIPNTGFTPPTTNTAQSGYYNFIAYCQQAGIPFTTVQGFGNGSASASYIQNGGIGIIEYLRSPTSSVAGAGGPNVTISSAIIKDIDNIYGKAISNAPFSARAQLLQTSSATGPSLTIDDLLKVALPTDGLAAIAGYIGSARNNNNGTQTRIVTGVQDLARKALTRNSAPVINPITDAALDLLAGVAALIGTGVTTTGFGFLTPTNIVTAPQSLLPAVTSGTVAPAKIRLASFGDSVVKQAFGWIATGTQTTEQLTGLVGAVGNATSGNAFDAANKFATTVITNANGFSLLPGSVVVAIVAKIAADSGIPASSATLVASLMTADSKTKAASNLLVLLAQETGTQAAAVTTILSLPASEASGWSYGLSPTYLMLYGIGISPTDAAAVISDFDTSPVTLFNLSSISGWTTQTGTRPNLFAKYIPAFFSFLNKKPDAISAAYKSQTTEADARTDIGSGIAQLINAGGAISGTAGRKLDIPALITLFGGNSQFANSVITAHPLAVVPAGIFADLTPVLQSIGVATLAVSFGAGNASAVTSSTPVGQIIMSNWALAFTDPVHFPALQQAGFRISDLLSYTRTMTRYSGNASTQSSGFPTAASSTLSVLAFDVLHEKCLEAYGVTETQVQAIALAQGIILSK